MSGPGFARGRLVVVVNDGMFAFAKINCLVNRLILHAGIGLALLALPCFAQDIEPRRWSHLPIGSNFGGTGYAYTSGEIFLNPVLRLEDGEFDLQTTAVKYIHSFELFGKSARVDLTQPYQSGTWSGLLNGSPTSVDRDGWADTNLRFAVNLYGAPPLTGREFAAYRATADCETIVGLGLLLQVPTGEYMEDKLINLGTNRFTFTPQFGVVHNRGKWSMEVSSSANFYTDNNDYFNGNTLEESCYLTGQGHLIYTFLPGFWISASTGYGYGGTSTINGKSTDDRKGNFGWGLSLGVPISRAAGFKLGYIGTRTDQDTGADTETFIAALSVMW
jgi:hypothetical protein